MAAPTPEIKTFWDGYKGQTRYYAAFTAGAPDNLSNSTVIDVSALNPVPSSNAIKLISYDLLVNGNLEATLEFDDVASGTVNTTTADTRVTWVSGDQFDTNWLTWGNSTITINSVEYTISSVDSATQITLTADPGDQSGVAYDVDEFIDRFSAQTNISFNFTRDYDQGPNSGLTPTASSSNFAGDLTLTTSGAADGDEVSLLVLFKR
jgi:hypothetical protein